MEHLSNASFPVGIGKLSALTGCCPETIRYYENEGLLSRPLRTAGGHRKYSENQYRLLMFIRRAKTLGFSQPDVRRLVSMANPDRTDCESVHGLATHQRQVVQEKIRDLKQLEETLKNLISDCESEEKPAQCPMIASLLDCQTGKIANPHIA